MDIYKAITLVSSKFIYTPDIKTTFDVWRVMDLGHGVFRGDCEDFALTVIWYACDCSRLKFLWKTCFTREYQLHQVYDFKGNRHVVGSNDGLWFDNWTMKALNRSEFFQTTKHEYVKTYFLPSMIFALITGFWVKKFKE